MKNISIIFCLFLFACQTHHATPYTAYQIAIRYDSTETRKAKLSRGITDYEDLTLKGAEFFVKDTVSYIGVDNQRLDYILFGRMENGMAVKCYFANKNDIEHISVKQVVGVSGINHGAIIKRVRGEDMPEDKHIIAVQMQNCTLVNN